VLATPILGLIGGICSGKTFVAQELGKLGAAVLDADGAGHQTLREPDVIQAVADRWGANILDHQGQVVRSALADIVFAPPPNGPGELRFLEQLTHPRIGRLLLAEIDRRRCDPNTRLIVLDAPVMFRAGWNSFCNWIAFVDSPRSVRLDRARARGWSNDDFDRREAAQESLAAKQQLADVILDNSESRESSIAQVQQLWERWIGSIPAC
jgi:dephospho-CoA kinase